MTEGPAAEDYGGNPAPGALAICLTRGPDGPCISQILTPSWAKDANAAPAWEPHYLFDAKPVYPQGRGAPPLLKIMTGSLNSGNGDQIVATQLLRYDSTQDSFTRVFAKTTGRNNNQEVRFIEDGPLKGSVISAEPAENFPYGYWIEVQRFTSQRTYRQVLRYLSATLYGDGNPLATIDSEMPTIHRRLGLWKPGQPLPLPVGTACPKPHLKNRELWCE